MKIFISHSSSDGAAATALALLFEKAFSLRKNEIRCTSAPGFGLRAGEHVSTSLRDEVLEAAVVVSLLTPSSIDSRYVLFELGARWATKKPMLPAVACGLSVRALTPPLSELHALDLKGSAEVKQLLVDVQQFLHLPLADSGSIAEQIEAVTASVAAQLPTPQQQGKQSVVRPDRAISAVATRPARFAPFPVSHPQNQKLYELLDSLGDDSKDPREVDALRKTGRGSSLTFRGRLKKAGIYDSTVPKLLLTLIVREGPRWVVDQVLVRVHDPVQIEQGLELRSGDEVDVEGVLTFGPGTLLVVEASKVTKVSNP